MIAKRDLRVLESEVLHVTPSRFAAAVSTCPEALTSVSTRCSTSCLRVSFIFLFGFLSFFCSFPN